MNRDLFKNDWYARLLIGLPQEHEILWCKNVLSIPTIESFPPSKEHPAIYIVVESSSLSLYLTSKLEIFYARKPTDAAISVANDSIH